MTIIEEPDGSRRVVSVSPSDRLDDIAAYTRMTVWELVEILNEIIIRGYGKGEIVGIRNDRKERA